MTPGAEHSIWLLPEAAQLAALTTLVGALAPGFCGAAFMPHVTVQGDLARPLDALQRDVAALAAQTPALTVPVTALEHGPHFFRCLLLRLDAGAAFDALQQRSAALNATRAGLSPYAHLSIAYGDATTAALGRVPRATIERDWVGHLLRLDQLAVVRSSQSVPIADWRVLARFALRA